MGWVGKTTLEVNIFCHWAADSFRFHRPTSPHLPCVIGFDSYWFDQDTITLPVTEPGLLYGATVFTTLRVYDQSLRHPLSHWIQHRQRLQASLTQLQWRSPDWEALTHAAETLAKTEPVLRITCFPGDRGGFLGGHYRQT